MSHVRLPPPFLELHVVSTAEHPWQAVLTEYGDTEYHFDNPHKLIQHLARLVRRQAKRSGLK